MCPIRQIGNVTGAEDVKARKAEMTAVANDSRKDT